MGFPKSSHEGERTVYIYREPAQVLTTINFTEGVHMCSSATEMLR